MLNATSSVIYRAGLWRAALALLVCTAILNAETPTPPVLPGGPRVTSDLDGKTIRSVRLVGNKAVSEAFIFSQIHTRAGNAYSAQQIEQDLRALTLTKQFVSVSVTPIEDRNSGQVDVIFKLEERPTVSGIEFRGNKKFTRDELLKELDVKTDQSLDPVQVQTGRDTLEHKYKSSGYYFAQVTVDQEALKEGRVVFDITEGPRVRIRGIKFEGNKDLPDDLLRTKLETQEYFLLLVKGDVDNDKLDRDVVTLRNYLREEGYLDARVTRRLDFSENRKDCTVIFIIQEGTRYKVKSVAVLGNKVFTNEELMPLIKIKPGDYLVESQLKADREVIGNRYGSNGYIYSTVNTTWVYTDQPGEVDLTFQVNEGKAYKFGEIRVVGNEMTQDKVVRRELRFYPEQPYNLPETKEAEKRIKDTRLFTNATISAIGDSPDSRDALVKVAESDMNKFMFGGGLSSDSGIIGNISLENQNFDLFDWPRDANELFRGKAFKGAGQYLRLQFEPGTELTRARLDFRDPYFNDWPISFGYSLYYFNRERTHNNAGTNNNVADYYETRYGQTISFGKEIQKPWAGEIALRTEAIDISRIRTFMPQEIRDVAGVTGLITLRPSIVRDTTDSIFLPSRGSRFSVSWEQAIVQFQYAKLGLKYSKYFTLGEDIYDRKHILGLNVELGGIIGDAPTYEEFYLGGTTTVRGFAFRTISPRKGFRHTVVGGDYMALLNAEYGFPLISKEIRGVLFADAGNSSDQLALDGFRAAVGFGIRIQIDWFGPVPLAFDFALPIAAQQYDLTQIFSFNVGATFR